MLAVLLSILAAVLRFSQARVSALGELGQTRDYVDLARHPEAIAFADLLVVRKRLSRLAKVLYQVNHVRHTRA